MSKVVYWTHFGGHTLPDVLRDELRAMGHKRPGGLRRSHPDLVSVVERYIATEDGKEYGLCVRHVGDRMWWIHDYDGKETVLTDEEIPWGTVGLDD